MKREKEGKAIGTIATAGAGALLGISLLLLGMPSHAQSGASSKDAPIDQATREAVIQSVASQLDRYYVFPQKAASLDTQLRTRMQHGDFDGLTGDKFADALTKALQQDSQDKHLEVRYFADPVPVQPAGNQTSPSERAADLLEGRRFNFGINSAGRLQGNIGYIDMHEFGRPAKPFGAQAAAAMSLLGDTQALIIDLRKCSGGDPDTVMAFASYLFDQPTHLNDVYWRDENRIERRWTTASVPGRKYGQARKVYLLTSGDTFSGCEDFAYALKNNGRATLIGESTGGGAHAGSPHRLSAHFMMFVPSGRPISPVTHTDWEGVGVVPDIKAQAKDALDLAQSTALKAMIATEADPRWKEKLQERLKELN